MPRGLRRMRTMRDVWDERRKTSAGVPKRPRLVRRFASVSAARSHRAPEGAVPLRTWVFSKGRGRPLPEKQLLVKRTREPEVDLFDEEDKLIVLAELPGLSEEDIQINVEDDLLIIEAVSTTRAGELHYYKEVMLPYTVAEDFGRSCKSGVLEIHLQPQAERKERKKRSERKSKNGKGSADGNAKARPGKESK